MKFQFILSIVLVLFLGSGSQILAADCERARQLIGLISHPNFPEVVYQDFSIEAQVVTQKSEEQLEKDFWKSSFYAAMLEKPVNYAWVEATAKQQGGIDTFRVRNTMASELFLSRYTEGDLRVKLKKELPIYNGLGTGYVDYLSDAFGDQLFLFHCKNDSILEVTISHANN